MSADLDQTGLLAANMAGAWVQRAGDAVKLLQVASVAAALVKPETIEQAHADYDRAVAEVGRWSA